MIESRYGWAHDARVAEAGQRLADQRAADAAAREWLADVRAEWSAAHDGHCGALAGITGEPTLDRHNATWALSCEYSARERAHDARLADLIAAFRPEPTLPMSRTTRRLAQYDADRQAAIDAIGAPPPNNAFAAALGGLVR